jgi:hypothetical protein
MKQVMDEPLFDFNELVPGPVQLQEKYSSQAEAMDLRGISNPRCYQGLATTE